MDEAGFTLAKEWLLLTQSFPYVPISRQAPLKAGRTNAFRLTLHGIEGLQTKNSVVELQAFVTLFNLSTKSFFGNTCIGTKYRCKVGQNLVFDSRFYYHTSITDPNCVAVIELVQYVSTNVGLQQASVGWTFLRSFDNSIVRRQETKNKNVPTSYHSVPLYAGTPRGLMLIDGTVENFVTAAEGNPKLLYIVESYSPFKLAVNLLRENEIVSKLDPIPGLESGLNGVTNLDEPKLIFPMYCITISNLTVHISERFEAQLFASLELNHKLEFGNASQKVEINQKGTPSNEKIPITIAERRIKLCLHNSRNIVTLQILTLEERDGNFVAINTGKLFNYISDKRFAVVFQLEYQIRVTLPAYEKDKSLSYIERDIPLGYFPFVPLNIPLLKQEEITIDLFTGSAKSPIDNNYVYNNLSKEELSIDCLFEINQDNKTKEESEELPSRIISKSQRENDEFPVYDKPFVRENSASISVQKTNKPEEDQNFHIKQSNQNYPTVSSSNRRSAINKGRLSRSNRLLLNNVPFVSITDRHGNKPTEILDTTIKPKLEIEHSDTLQNNEIILQFLTFTPLIPSRAKPSTFLDLHQVQKIFFTLQFYRYPMVVTGIYNLEPNLFGEDNDHIKIIENNLTKLKGSEVRFTGEGEKFINYILSKPLSINIWDGDSLLLLGSVDIDLSPILRQGREAVHMVDEYDLIQPEFLSRDISKDQQSLGTNQTDFVRGSFMVKITNIGSASNPPFVENHNILMVNKPYSNNQASTTKTWPKKQKDCDKELSLALAYSQNTNTPNFPSELEKIDNKKRKLERYKVLSQQLNAGKTTNINRQDRDKELKVIQFYREKQRKSVITSKLQSSLTTRCKIYPSFGSSSYFEFEFQNPYPEEHCFSISINDPELSLVKDITELRFFKKAHNIASPSDLEPLQGNKLILNANEQLRLSLKFLSMHCGYLNMFPFINQNEQSNTLFDNIIEEEKIQERTVIVSILNQYNQIVNVLEIEIHPIPFIVDKTFHFYAGENDFLKKTIVMPKKYKEINYKVLCNSSSVVVMSSSSKLLANIQEISIKYRCGSAPEITRFYILLYEDNFKISLPIIWQIFVHSVQRLDIPAVVGESSKSSIIVRGGSTSHLVKCYTSIPNEMKAVPDSTFTLVGGALNEINLIYKPYDNLKKQILINIVDTEFNKLISAWIVSVMCQEATITQQFDIKMVPNKSTSKKITYSNPYPHKKKFIVFSSRPEFLEPKENINFDLQAFESTQIPILFKPLPNFSKMDVLLFINDADVDKTEECIKFAVSFTKT